MTTLAAFALLAAAQGPSGPVGPINPGQIVWPPKPILAKVNLLANGSFSKYSYNKPVGWDTGAVLSFKVDFYEGAGPQPYTYPMTCVGPYEWGHDGNAGFIMGPYSFGWSGSYMESDYALMAYARQTLTDRPLGSAIVDASVWCLTDGQELTATIYYTIGRPTKVTKWLDPDGFSTDWVKFDFKSAIDPNRTVTGVQFSGPLEFHYDYSGYGIGFYQDDAPILDEASLSILVKL